MHLVMRALPAVFPVQTQLAIFALEGLSTMVRGVRHPKRIVMWMLLPGGHSMGDVHDVTRWIEMASVDDSRDKGVISCQVTGARG